MNSRAAILREPIDSPNFTETTPASVEEITVAEPTGEEVLVEITAASLCHTDVAIARGHISEEYPLVMGHEGAGIVHAVGEDVTSVSPGDQVVLGRPTCGQCAQCRAGNGNLCTRRYESRHAGTLRTGAIGFELSGGSPAYHCHGVSSFSEYTLVTEEVAIGVPDQLSAEQSSLLGCGVFTGVGAVTNTANIETGSSVVVFGLGGVGLSAVQAARISGAGTIVAVDPIKEKRAVAEQVGADTTIDPADETDVVARINDHAEDGFDYAFEVVGHEEVVRQAVETLAPQGTCVLVGIPPAGMRDLSIDLYDIVVSEKRIIGSFNGSYSLPLAIPRLAQFVVDGELQLEPLITASKSLADLNEAMGELETGTNIRQIITP